MTRLATNFLAVDLGHLDLGDNLHRLEDFSLTWRMGTTEEGAQDVSDEVLALLKTLRTLEDLSTVNLTVKVTDSWVHDATNAHLPAIRKITRKLLRRAERALLKIDTLSEVSLTVMDWITVDGKDRYEDISTRAAMFSKLRMVDES